MLRNKIGAVVAALAAVAVSFVVVPSASAHPHCAGWKVGVFANPNYGGTRGCFNVQAPDLRQFGLNNTISSGWSHDTVPWCFYDGFNYTSPFGTLYPGDHYNFADWANNRASSIRRGACPGAAAISVTSQR